MNITGTDREPSIHVTGKDHRHFRSRLHAIVLKHVWDQLFTVNKIWSIGETGDIYSQIIGHSRQPLQIKNTKPNY